MDHLGSTLNSGHYICHIKLETKWITCNDSYITESYDHMCGRSRNNYYYLYSKIIKPNSAIHLCGEWQELKGRTLPVGQYDKYFTAGKTFVKDINHTPSHVSPSSSKNVGQSDKDDIIVINDSDDDLKEVNISPKEGFSNYPEGSLNQSSLNESNDLSNEAQSNIEKASLGKRKGRLSLNKNKKQKLLKYVCIVKKKLLIFLIIFQSH